MLGRRWSGLIVIVRFGKVGVLERSTVLPGGNIGGALQGVLACFVGSMVLGLGFEIVVLTADIRVAWHKMYVVLTNK